MSREAAAPPVTRRVTTSVPALIAQAASVGFILALAALHVLKSDLDPSWHFISEYAIGSHGWLMTLAFLSLAVAVVCLVVGLRGEGSGFWFGVGLALLLVSGVGLLLGGLFVTDPINTPAGEVTTSGMLHNIGGSLGIALPAGIGILTWRLRSNPSWEDYRRLIGWLGVLAVGAGLLALVAVSALFAGNDGQFGPETPVGWFNRLEVIMAAAWIFAVGGVRARIPGPT